MKPGYGATVIMLATLVVITGFILWVASEYVPLAQAQGESDCADYKSQEEAQEDLRNNPSDPFSLDGSPGEGFEGERGVACEEYDYPLGSPRDERSST